MGCEIVRLTYQNSDVANHAHPHGVTFYRNHLHSVQIGLSGAANRPMNNLRLINNMTGDIVIGDSSFTQDFNDLQVLNNVIKSYLRLVSRQARMTGVCRNNLFFEDSRSFLEMDNFHVSFVDNVVMLTGDTHNLRSGLHRPVWPDLTVGNVFVGAVQLKSEDEPGNLVLAREEFQMVFPDWVTAARGARIVTNAAAWARIADDHPAKTAGVDGGEPGIFGGPHPFDPYQMPPLPFISRIQAPAIVSEGEGMQVTVEIKSHR